MARAVSRRFTWRLFMGVGLSVISFVLPLFNNPAAGSNIKISIRMTYPWIVVSSPAFAAAVCVS